jgi:endonuclease III related protein
VSDQKETGIADSEVTVEIYDRLYAAFGPQNWWPAESPFEVIVGAVLTQNTAWTNVEKAIAGLRKNHLIDIKAMAQVPEEKLANVIRPSGFFRLKAKYLKTVVRFISESYGGKLDQMWETEGAMLRRELLLVKGLGPETVDSILLYAGAFPYFVVDAYTRRIFSRHHFFRENQEYHLIQRYFMSSLANDAQLFNEYHALIVQTAKRYCHRRNPDCAACPLGILPGFKPLTGEANGY